MDIRRARLAVLLLAIGTASFLGGTLARAQHGGDGDFDYEKELKRLDGATRKTFDDLLDQNKKAHDMMEQLKKPHVTYEDAIKLLHEVADGIEKLAAQKKVSEQFKKSNLVNPYYNAACMEALAGKKADALKDLAKALDAGWHDFKHIDEDKDLESLRSDPEFKALLEKSKAAQNEANAKAREKLSAEIKKSLGKPPLFEIFDFEAKAIDGKDLKLAEMKGKVVVLNLWATWCQDGVEMLGEVEKVYQATKGQEVVVIGFADEGSRDEADKYVESFASQYNKNAGLHFPLATIARDGRIYESIPDLRPQSLPVTLFLDKQGKVRVRREGKQKSEALETIALTLLDAK